MIYTRQRSQKPTLLIAHNKTLATQLYGEFKEDTFWMTQKAMADVFEQCSYDYDKNSEITKAFYAFVQNKLHVAVIGKTVEELIYENVVQK